MLATCKNVDEAKKFLVKYNMPGLKQSHILIADKYGNSTILEWGTGDYKFYDKNSDFQVLTNFNLTDTNIGWYPCSRYNRTEKILNSSDIISLDYFEKLLNNVKQKNTVYSNIYNLKTGDIYIYFKGGFSRIIRLNIDDLLKK